MTREEWNCYIDDHRITSLGKLEFGYVVYADTAKSFINQLINEIEILDKRINELEELNGEKR